MTVLISGNFPLGVKKIMLFPGGILVPAPCAICQILFENEFFLMAPVGPSIICLYSRVAPVVG